MTTVASAVPAHTHAPVDVPSVDVRVALLGLGQVGSAVAALARAAEDDTHRFTITSALVRNAARLRSVDGIPLVTDPAIALDPRPDVVVEVLGGVEPARTLILEALARGIPVVTANKSLLAAYGDDLFAAADRTGTPLLYEASVLAGVPFLGTFSRRPWIRDVTALSGIVNGTSNFILSRMAAGRVPFAQALASAQRTGYAEPDPSKDLRGDDAVEKLCVLMRHFGGLSVSPSEVDRTGIEEIEQQDLEQAAAFGGVVRPLVAADWTGGHVTAFAGPAFLPLSNPLARIDGVQNAVVLRTRWSGDLFYAGPGAGPTVTAATVLDDVIETRHGSRVRHAPQASRRSGVCGVPETGWFVRLNCGRLQDAQQGPGLLGGLGVRVRRSSALFAGNGTLRQWILTAACGRDHVAAALDVLAARTGASTRILRAFE
jgi:homoserine dehydrogenase